jgi:hypothetical protein
MHNAATSNMNACLDNAVLPVMLGIIGAFVGTIAAQSILVAPAVNGGVVMACGGGVLILGVPGVPVDAIITGTDRVVDKDAIAARRFSDLINGKSKKASKKVFSSLIKQIQKL